MCVQMLGGNIEYFSLFKACAQQAFICVCGTGIWLRKPHSPPRPKQVGQQLLVDHQATDMQMFHDLIING